MARMRIVFRGAIRLIPLVTLLAMDAPPPEVTISVVAAALAAGLVHQGLAPTPSPPRRRPRLLAAKQSRHDGIFRQPAIVEDAVAEKLPIELAIDP